MASRNITTLRDYYDGVCIRIFQGKHIKASMNWHLGDHKLTGLPCAPRGAVSIKLDFHVPSKGVLTVLAKSKDTESVLLHVRRSILIEVSVLLRSAVECTIEGIEKMICSTRKDFLPSYLRFCEGRLADLKKTMHSGDLPFLKSLLAEAARLDDEITRYIPSEPESTDSDGEVV